MTLTGIIKDISAPWLLFSAFRSDIDCWFNLNLGPNPSFFSGLTTGTDPCSPAEEQERGEEWLGDSPGSEQGGGSSGVSRTYSGSAEKLGIEGKLLENASKRRPGWHFQRGGLVLWVLSALIIYFPIALIDASKVNVCL